MHLNNHWNSLPVVYKSEKQMKDTLMLPQTNQISTTKLSECGMSFWSPDNCNWSLVRALKFRSNLLQLWMFIKGLRHDFLTFLNFIFSFLMFIAINTDVYNAMSKLGS